MEGSSSEDGGYTNEERQAMINRAKEVEDPNRKEFAVSYLLSEEERRTLTLHEVIGTAESNEESSIGFIKIPIEDQELAENEPEAYFSWGIFTGWMLFNNGCWMHGTFYWTGSPSNYLFVMDMNPYTDNHIGNEPRCMSDSEFDSFC